MSDWIIPTCAIVGAVLGIVNFTKDCLRGRKDKQVRTKQCLVRAEYRKVPNQHGNYLYLVATRPVTDLRVQFDAGDPFAQQCLGPDQPILVKKFRTQMGEKRYLVAKMTYKDSDGYEHTETQRNIPCP